MGALFKLLQKAYPDLEPHLVVNPNLVIDITENDCLLTIDKNEFLVNFSDESCREILMQSAIATCWNSQIFLGSKILYFQYRIFPNHQHVP